MELSAREQEEAELRQRQEEEELQRIIQLSLMEKWREYKQAKKILIKKKKYPGVGEHMQR